MQKYEITLEILVVCGQRLDGLEERDPVGCKDGLIRHNLPVSLDLALTSMKINRDVESIRNVELDDV